MGVSRSDVLEILQSDEPDYDEGARLGAAAIKYLKQLASTADPLMAAKATHLAALIVSPESRDVIDVAAHRPEPEVRVAAAAAMGEVSSAADRENVDADLLDMLMKDPDPGVRKLAARSAGRDTSAHLLPLENLAGSDPAEHVRDEANRSLAG